MTNHKATDKSINLSGEWGFFWDELLTQPDFDAQRATGDFVWVPRMWNGYDISGKDLQGHGYGTFRLRVTGADPTQALGHYLPAFATSYRIL